MDTSEDDTVVEPVAADVLEEDNIPEVPDALESVEEEDP